MVVLVAGALIAILAISRGPDAAAEPDSGTAPASPAASTTEGVLVTAVLTANAYDAPARNAELLWILPAGQQARLEGRAEASDWALVSYPPGSAAVGWVRAASLGLAAEALAAAPVAAVNVVAGSAPRDTARITLPDLTIADVFLLQHNRIAVAIRNVGDAPVRDASMSLVIARAEGDILGVLRIGPTTLSAGATATIVTEIAAERPGTYLVSLDDGNEVAERQESNNALSVLLIPAGGNAPPSTPSATPTATDGATTTVGNAASGG